MIFERTVIYCFYTPYSSYFRMVIYINTLNTCLACAGLRLSDDPARLAAELWPPNLGWAVVALQTDLRLRLITTKATIGMPNKSSSHDSSSDNIDIHMYRSCSTVRASGFRRTVFCRRISFADCFPYRNVLRNMSCSGAGCVVLTSTQRSTTCFPRQAASG